MKIRIENDRLIVRGFWREKFNASSDEIVELRFLAEHKYYGPKFLVWLIGSDLFLRAIIVWIEKENVVLESRDSGFDGALKWFKEKGWDVNEGRRLAFQTPLVRATVPRRGVTDEQIVVS